MFEFCQKPKQSFFLNPDETTFWDMDMERPVYLPLLIFEVGAVLVHVIFFIWYWYTHIYKVILINNQLMIF